MTVRVKRQAVLVVTWIVVTTSATAMASWAVTFVTDEVAYRRPLGPSDVVAASVLPATPVPSWAYGPDPEPDPVPTATDSPAVAADVGTSPAAVSVPAKGTARLAGPAVHTGSRPAARLAAGWFPTHGTPGLAAASVTPPVAGGFVPATVPTRWAAATRRVNNAGAGPVLRAAPVARRSPWHSPSTAVPASVP